MCAVQNGRTAKEVALEYDFPEIAAMIEAEDRRRKAVEMSEVAHKMTSEWGAVLGVKLREKGLEGPRSPIKITRK